MKNFFNNILTGWKISDEMVTDNKNSKKLKYMVLFFSLLLVILLGIIDHKTGFEVSFSIFYLIPISISVLFGGFYSGIIISLFSAVIWALADIYSGHQYENFLIPLWNAIMRLGYFSLHSFFMSRFLEMYKKVKKESLTDSLTAVTNSRFFYILFEQELMKAKRSKKPFTLAYIDLDNFKSVNDTYGHLEGDSLLIKIAQTIKKNIRETDILARIGGDEFILLLPETDYKLSDNILKRLKDVVLIEVKKNDYPVTLSIGAITFNKFDYEINDMIKQADDLMYKIKREGKNNVEHKNL
ncbi:MAG: GGDEF domain-containing protein [candidate division WOR-3 bacterium]